MQKFLKATLIVTVFSVATRALGFLLRIYLSRVMGAEALGAYQISVSIFGVLMTIICSGLPLIVSRNVAYYHEKDSNMQYKNITAGLIVGLVLSIVISVVFCVFPNQIVSIVGSKESVDIVLILLPALVASSIYAILRGGLWGQKYFFTISFTEFFEQVVRIILVAILFNVNIVAMSSAKLSALSLSVSATCSCLLVIVLYFAFGGKLRSPKNVTWSIVKTSTPITFVRTVSSAIGSIIAIVLPARLMLGGMTNGEALAQFGIFMGMTFPLLMIPATFISSIAVALVPELSKYTNNIDKTQNVDRVGLSEKIVSSIKTTIAISFVLMPAFIAIGSGIGEVLFANADSGKYLAVFAISMLPMGIAQITSSVLNAVGLEIKELINYICGAIILVVCVIFLPPYIGIYAIGVGIVVMHTIITVLNIMTLKKRQLVDLSFLKTIVISLVICASVSVLGYFVFNLLSKFCNLFLSTCLSGAICEIFNILLMYVFNVAQIKLLFVKFSKKKNGNKKTL